MARSFLYRFGVAQISVNPAYADELASFIQEPAFPPNDEKIGLFSIAGLEEIARLQQRIAEKYIAHLNHKIESIIRFAAEQRLELLAFPEYSIPPETLPLCNSLSEELGITIIAGSHVITLNPAAQQIYRNLQLTIPEAKQPLEERVRQAACIVFVPKQRPVAFIKYVRSKWESCLIKGEPTAHIMPLVTPKGSVELEVRICIEALSTTARSERRKLPRLTVITSFTPTTDPFHDEGRRGLLQGHCTAFSNVAEFGGSKIFARAGAASLWFTEKDGSAPIPKNSEALLVIEADLEKQFEVRQLATEHTAVADLRLFPIMYSMDSVETQKYSELLEELKATVPSPAEISAQISSFINLTPNIFPKLLQDKLAFFVGHVGASGVVTPQEAVSWVTPLAIRDIRSTDALRWELCTESIDTVNDLVKSMKYVHKTKELSDVYLHLVNTRNRLAGSLQLRGDEVGRKTLSQRATTPSPESPFIDRDTAFDKIRQFFSQQQSSILIIGGMRGIGKTSLVHESFRQAIPNRKKFWVQITEGMSFQRLLAELAFGCNIQLPPDLDLSADTTQVEIRRRVLNYLKQGPSTVIVLDDFQYLLNTNGEIDDPRIAELLLGLAEAGQNGRAKYFFISHIFPKFRPSFESYSIAYTLHGLEPNYTRRLLTQWIQFMRDDASTIYAEVSERLISVLGGHPLAIKVAARQCADHPSADVAQEFSIFKELRDTIVSFILEKLSLAPAEKELLSFASIFRIPAPREIFLQWKKEDASYLLNSLSSHYLIESSDRGYQLHPLVRSFFAQSLPLDQLKEWHKTAGKFYLREFERMKESSKQVVPEFLGEAVHHFLAAGERTRVQNFAFYREELRPVALEHFRSRDHAAALKDYQILVDIDTNDIDAHFHLCLIYAGMKDWDDAELHFGKAISIRPRAPWILQGYAAANLRAGRLVEGEALLLESIKYNSSHPATLVSLGRLREDQGRIADAEKYYRQAIDIDPDNPQGLYRLARLLYSQGAIPEAYAMAQAALRSNPTHPSGKALLHELSRRVKEDVETPKPAKRTAVQVRCVQTNDKADIHEKIEMIGGVNSDGKPWRTTLKEAVAHTESGKYIFYVETPKGQKDLVVIQTSSGKKYLKTNGDGDQLDALLRLPSCMG